MYISPIASNISPEVSARWNNKYIWAIAFVAALGGLLFGYDWVVIGGAKPFFEKYFGLQTSALVGWANSCALVGCLIGSLTCAGLSDWLGRKKMLLASAFLFAVSAVLTGWCHSFAAFVIWRILGGVAIGVASALSPMYIAEIAPAHMRGRLVALNQLTIVIGVLGAQIVNMLIARPVPPGATFEFIRDSWNGQLGWRWMFTVVTLPSLIFFASALFIPESPRWLLEKGQVERAQQILLRVGGHQYAETEIKNSLALMSSNSTSPRIRDVLFPPTRKILLLGCTLAVLQQWSGINVIFNYAEEIYRAAGYGVSEILFNIVITGAINLVFTLIALWTVDRFGRRALMLVGCAGVCLSHILIGLAYRAHLTGPFVLIFTLAAIGCYAMSLAPVTWVLISEIFPNRVRGAAMSIAVSVLWVACLALTYFFPVVNARIGAADTFWLFAAISAAGFIFVKVYIPETKNRTLEQIELALTT